MIDDLKSTIIELGNAKYDCGFNNGYISGRLAAFQEVAEHLGGCYLDSHNRLMSELFTVCYGVDMDEVVH